MAFKILKNVSKRYTDNPGVAQSETGGEADDRSRLTPRGPITLRQPDDETGTDRVTSEEPVVDDSPELPTPQSHAQRRQLARWRLNYSKQYVRDGLEEAGFQNEVFWVALGRFLPQIFHYTVGLAYQLIVSIFDLLSRLGGRFVDMLVAITLAFIEMLNDVGDWCAHAVVLIAQSIQNLVRSIVWSAVNLLRFTVWFLHLTVRILRGLLQQVNDWGRLAILTIGLAPIVFGVIRGYEGMVNYVCNDHQLLQEYKSFGYVCNHPYLRGKLRVEHHQLQELMAISESIIEKNQNHNMVQASGWYTYEPFVDLRHEINALAHFMKEHREDLSNPNAYDEIVQDMFNNATFLLVHSQHFSSAYRERVQEWIFKLNNVLDSTKGAKKHSPPRRFFSETIYAIMPALFTHTNTAKQVRNYIRVAKHYQNASETLVLYENPDVYQEAVNSIRRGRDLIRDELITHPEPFPVDCKEFKDRYFGKECIGDTDSIFESLDAVVPQAHDFAAQFERGAQHHLLIVRGLNRLHLHLSCLLEDAFKKKKAPYMPRVDPALIGTTWESYVKPVDAMTARSILREFIVHVGAMDTFFGPTTPEHPFIIGLKIDGKEPSRGSEWKLLPDGTYERHLDQYATHPGIKQAHGRVTKAINMPPEEDEN